MKLSFTSDPSHVEPGIAFHFEYHVEGFGEPEAYRRWIHRAVAEEKKELLRVDYIFVSDEQLHALNVQHLAHDTLTDILTFPYRTDPIEAEIFISVERVAENAAETGVSFLDELRRVMIHGILHMCGWSDRTPPEKQAIRAREDHFLGRWSG